MFCDFFQVSQKVTKITVQIQCSTAYSCNDVKQAIRLLGEFQLLHSHYCGMPLRDADVIDMELVSHVIADLNQGKAAGIDGLTAEHLLFAHPALSVLLAKLFQLMMAYGYVSNGFVVALRADRA